ncbi:hypothetical protein SteCoe_7774 [Stentor coeruleus]|uniref:Uncharacterized protein n=1 Tax=Stentor coeruleus TaxID=5963 RepID=A0A1R2CLY9_9CILI|nr:hypothetical protein SteCoe_7774 [Stentor coeruleus]
MKKITPTKLAQPFANYQSYRCSEAVPEDTIITYSPMNPSSGTVVKLPSGKTAIAHGSGIEILRQKIKKERDCRKNSSSSSSIQHKPPKSKKPPKVVSYTLEEIIEIYDNQTNLL